MKIKFPPCFPETPCIQTIQLYHTTFALCHILKFCISVLQYRQDTLESVVDCAVQGMQSSAATLEDGWQLRAKINNLTLNYGQSCSLLNTKMK